MRWPMPGSRSSRSSSTSTAPGGSCPTGIAATAGRSRPTTTRPRSARPARPRSARRSAGWRPATTVRSSSSRSTVRSARTARSRRSSRRSTSPTPGRASPRRPSGWTRRSSSGSAAASGCPVVDWREVRAERWATDPDAVRTELAAFAAGAGDPRLMVKPARLGSSVGMTLVHEAAELPGALDLAFAYDTLALVETYVAGARDLEVSVIGNDPGSLELYGPGEVIAGHEFYDYAAKYTPGLSETTTTAEVTPAQRAILLKIARDCYRAIGAEGFARVDFLLAGEDVYLSEINTIPGFTPISLFPTLPAVAGYTFADVCVRVVDLAVAATRRSRPPPPAPRGPAPVTDRRPARRPIATAAGRRTRPVRRASGRITPVRVVAVLIVVLMVGSDLRRDDELRLRLPPARGSTARATRRARTSRRRSRGSAAPTCSPCRRRRSRTILEDAHHRRRRARRRRAARHARGAARGARADPRLGGRRPELPRGRQGDVVRGAPRRPAGGGGRPPGRRRSPDRRRRASTSASPSTRSTSTPRRGSPRSCRATSAAGPTG